MSTTDSELDQIEELIRCVDLDEAEERLVDLISQMGPDEFAVWEPDLRRTIGEFLPKRRRRLSHELDSRLLPASAGQREIGEYDFESAEALGRRIADELENLSRNHIFQWSTFYRDAFASWWEELLENSVGLRTSEHYDLAIGSALEEHAREIFGKGYYFQTYSQKASEEEAIAKSLSGLQRFLDLPVELYAASLVSVDRASEAIALRSVASTMLRAILEGYGQVQLEGQTGWQVLPRFPRSWVSYVGFMTADDLERLTERIESGSLVSGLEESVLPLLAAIDGLLVDAAQYSALPALGQLMWDQRRLDLTFRSHRTDDSGAPLEAACFLDSTRVRLSDLKELANRNLGIAIGMLRPDLHEQIAASPSLVDVLVDTGMTSDPTETRRRVRDTLRSSLYRQQSPRSASSPITHNFAREFPLHNPFLTRYFFVHRRSVRELLRSFERRNGIRLWCSVRRSGKTTACFDLSESAGESSVVTQTCDSTDQRPRAALFYGAVKQALGDSGDLPSTFFENLVAECADSRTSAASRFVFMLDEYETLFGRLRLAARRDPELRYTVVQPLLNQMVQFSADNLIVLIGQQPDAHYILMDQNQLSSYVQQDVFPLFTHGTDPGGSEVELLLRKVLTERIGFDSSFADAVYTECGGHPFLTVKLMVQFVDWLISERRPLRNLSVAEQDFREFEAAGLQASAIASSSEYSFFREACREATSSDGLAGTPWLHFTYRLIRYIERESGGTGIPRSDAAAALEEFGVGEQGFSALELLSSAERANFLEFDGPSVRCRVRLLSRITGAAGTGQPR